MSTRKWLDNAFWHNSNSKDKVEAILEIQDNSGRKINQQLTVRKFDPEGNLNPDFNELITEIGIEKIDQNTEERVQRKSKEKIQQQEKRKAKEKAKELEKLFDQKIKVMEIPEIQETENKELRSKLRRSKNTLELNMYAMLILMESAGYELRKRSDAE